MVDGQVADAALEESPIRLRRTAERERRRADAGQANRERPRRLAIDRKSQGIARANESQMAPFSRLQP